MVDIEYISPRKNDHPLPTNRHATLNAKGVGDPDPFLPNSAALYSIAFTMSSTTFFASPNTIIVLSM